MYNPRATYCARHKGRVIVSMPPARYLSCQATVTHTRKERKAFFFSKWMSISFLPPFFYLFVSLIDIRTLWTLICARHCSQCGFQGNLCSNKPIHFHFHDVLPDLIVGAQQIFVNIARNKDDDLFIRLFKKICCTFKKKKVWRKFQLTINYLF